MTKAWAFRGFRFPAEVILWAVLSAGHATGLATGCADATMARRGCP